MKKEIYVYIFFFIFIFSCIYIFHFTCLQVDHPGMNGCGGSSIYYSHAMQMLFLSFVNAKTLMAPLTTMDGSLGPISQLQLSGKTPTSSNKVTAGQPLVAWSEVPHHPGLVLAMQQFSNNPIVILLKPGTAHVQEIKLVRFKQSFMSEISHFTDVHIHIYI